MVRFLPLWELLRINGCVYSLPSPYVSTISWIHRRVGKVMNCMAHDLFSYKGNTAQMISFMTPFHAVPENILSQFLTTKFVTTVESK